MRDVSIIGVGMTPVGEHWDKGLRELGAEAIQLALADAGQPQIDALYVGNAFSGVFSSQSHLGVLIADHARLGGVEAFTVNAADASGGAALRTAYMAVASGLVETALALGVEKASDAVAGHRVEARNVAIDAEFEAAHGATLPALAALLMRRYMHEYGLGLRAFEGFSINAHANGKRNPLAMFRNTVREGAFGKAPMVADPVNLFDGAPDADGSAALVLTTSERAADMVGNPVRIVGSAVATDTLKLQDRADMLRLDAVARSAQQALGQAGITVDDLSLMEIHDSFTIVSALTLEAVGLADRGKGWQLVDQIGLGGPLPISTFGGLKSRGNPIGATGIYQAAEATLQLRGDAGDNQVANAQVALIQNLGGLASTSVTHVLAV